MYSLWKALDPDQSGEVTLKELKTSLYRMEVGQWPDTDEHGLEYIVTQLNESVERRLQASGNWYKVFNLVDKDGSGRLSFDEMRTIVRDCWHGLAVTRDKVSDHDIRSFWKALDKDLS